MKKILIISVNALGDTYLSSSAIAPLREKYSDNCEIHLLFLNKTYNAFQLAKSLDIDTLWALPTKSVKSIIKLYLSLLSVKYDYVFSFFPGQVNTFYLMFLRASIRIGYPNFRKIVEWYASTQKVYSTIPEEMIYAWNPSMTYLERIGLCLSAGNIPYSILKKPLLKFQGIEKLKLQPYLLVHFSSSRTDRALNKNTQIDVLTFLSKKYKSSIIVLGWQGELEHLKNKFLSINNIRFEDDANLQTLTRFIISSELFIGVDSFPLHIADAYEIKYIGIFGPTGGHAFQSCPVSVVFPKEDLSLADGEYIVENIRPYLINNYTLK